MLTVLASSHLAFVSELEISVYRPFEGIFSHKDLR